MAIRRVGDCFLRCRDTPILSFLAPSINARTAWSRRQTPQRSFTASTYFHDDQSRPPPPSSDLDFARIVSENRSVLDILDETFEKHLTPKKPSSSANLVQDSFQADIHRPEDESRMSREGKIINSMHMPGEKPGGVLRTPVTNLRSTLKPRNTATIRSRPSLGRTVDVTPTGVARALQVLNYDIRANNVRKEQKRQRFHERPGLKRKRLKSERYRARFMIAFKATLRKVRDMRKKGW